MSKTDMPARIYTENDVPYIRADLVKEAMEALDEAEGYFDNRADADHDQDGYVPNEEMVLLGEVRAVLSKLKEAGL